MSRPLPRTLGALVLSGALALSACTAGDTTDTAATGAQGPAAVAPADTSSAPGVRVVSPAEGAELAARPGVVVLDVRTPEEFAEGHIADAINIDMQAADAASRFEELDPDASYVLYCRSGNRSAVVADHLRGLGFTDVADVDGGVLAWQAAGLPLER